MIDVDDLAQSLALIRQLKKNYVCSLPISFSENRQRFPGLINLFIQQCLFHPCACWTPCMCQENHVNVREAVPFPLEFIV